MFSDIANTQNCIILQQSLGFVSDWCVSNKLDLNASKCYILSFTRNKNSICFDYKVNQVTITRKYLVKILSHGLMIVSVLVDNR
nr:unnamed protein product [Callosobruchus analis]